MLVGIGCCNICELFSFWVLFCFSLLYLDIACRICGNFSSVFLVFFAILKVGLKVVYLLSFLLNWLDRLDIFYNRRFVLFYFLWVCWIWFWGSGICWILEICCICLVRCIFVFFHCNFQCIFCFSLYCNLFLFPIVIYKFLLFPWCLVLFLEYLLIMSIFHHFYLLLWLFAGLLSIF